MACSELWAVDYEIYGEVQGVFFRKYTEEQGRKLGLVGWVKNTPSGTVTGQVQGPKEKVEIIEFGFPFDSTCQKVTKDDHMTLGHCNRHKYEPVIKHHNANHMNMRMLQWSKNWLRCIGSPMSRIDQAVFSNERQISALEFQSFTTKY